MNDETQITHKHNEGSTFGKVSVRAWLTLLIVFTVCIMSLGTMKVEEPLYTLVSMAVGFYFGKNTPQNK